MELLTVLSSNINYISLAITVWLGWYILTRSIRNPISWLTSLTLWSISGIFINSILAIHPPPIPKNLPTWVAILFPFWEGDRLPEAVGWIAGWLAIPSVGFWHHVSMLVRPERWKFWHKIQVIVVYIATIEAILATRYTTYMFEEISGNPLLLGTLKPGVLFSTFFFLLAIIISMCVLNFNFAMQKAQSLLEQKQFRMLIGATLAAGLIAPVSLLDAWIDVSFPILVNTFLLAVSVVLIGISVGKYSALIEGRILRRDFLYFGVAMAIVALLYSLIIWISVLIFNVPPAAYLFIIVFTFATHSLVDTARGYLDRLFYRRKDRSLRQSIRNLAAQMGEQGLNETLELALDLTCTSVRANFGLIVLFENGTHNLAAGFKWKHENPDVSRNVLTADDFQQFVPGHLPAPLADATLLIPIYIDDRQIGTIILGPPVNSIRYQETEIERVLDVGDQIAATIQQMRLGNQLMQKAVHSVQVPTINPPKTNGEIHVQNLEDALRNLHDFAFLGDCQLAKTKLVSSRLTVQFNTHIDKGKIVYHLIEQAVIKLRPDKELPNGIPSREWFPYLILYQAYFENQLNRDIMASLYISEGTFNRTRRSAIRSITRVLAEQEKHQA